MTALLVFIAGVSYELSFLLWIRTSVDRRPLPAAFYSMLVGVLGVYAMRGAVSDTNNIVPLILGYGVGSYVVAKIGSK